MSLYLMSLNLLPKTHVHVFPHQLLLNNQLEMEKMKVEQEKKKCFLAQEALREKVKVSETSTGGNVKQSYMTVTIIWL